MPVYPAFYTDPAIGQGVSNLVAAFAPPDPATQAALAASRAELGMTNFEMAQRQRLASAMGQLYPGQGGDGMINYDQLNNAASAYGGLGQAMGDIMPFLTAQNMLRVEDPTMASNMGLANLNAQGVATGPDIATNVARQDQIAQRNSDLGLRDIWAAAEAGAAYRDPGDAGDFDAALASGALALALDTSAVDPESGDQFPGFNTLSPDQQSQALAFMAQLPRDWTYDERAQYMVQNGMFTSANRGGGWGGILRLLPGDQQYQDFSFEGPGGAYDINRNTARTGRAAPAAPLPTPQGGQPASRAAPPPINQRIEGETRVSTERGNFVWGRDETGNLGWVPDNRVSF